MKRLLRLTALYLAMSLVAAPATLVFMAMTGGITARTNFTALAVLLVLQVPLAALADWALAYRPLPVFRRIDAFASSVEASPWRMAITVAIVLSSGFVAFLLLALLP